MLPDVEINVLLMTVDDAVGFAAEGKLADGYAVLVAGLRRAEEARAAGEPWAEELVDRYRSEAENYCTRYGLPMEEGEVSDRQRTLDEIVNRVQQEIEQMKEEWRAAGWPHTVDEAVDRLLREIPPSEQAVIRDMAEDDLIGLHFGLGLYIRNAFGLWAGNKELQRDAQKDEPDGQSMAIIQALWRRLR